MPQGKREANAEIWRDRVHRWKASGLTSAKFAEREGIRRPQALSQWAYLLSRQSKVTSGSTDLKLIKVEPSPGLQKTRQHRADETAVVIESGRRRIKVSRGFDAETLRQVLAVMEVVQ